MTKDELRERLREECYRAGSQTAWCKIHRIAPGYVSDVINGRRAPGAKVLAALGLEIAFQPTGEK